MWFSGDGGPAAERPYVGEPEVLAERFEARFADGAALVRMAAARTRRGHCELVLVERASHARFLAAADRRRGKLRLVLRRLPEAALSMLLGSAVASMAESKGVMPPVWLLEASADGRRLAGRAAEVMGAAPAPEALFGLIEGARHDSEVTHGDMALQSVTSAEGHAILLDSSLLRRAQEGPAFAIGTVDARRPVARESLHALLEQLPLPATLWDDREQISRCNARFSEEMGLGLERIRGMGPVELDRALEATRFESSFLSATGVLYRMNTLGRPRIVQPVAIPLWLGGEAARLIVYFDWSAAIEMEDLSGKAGEYLTDGAGMVRTLQQVGNIATVLGSALPVIREERADELPEVAEDLESVLLTARELLSSLRANFMNLEVGLLERVDLGEIATRVARLHQQPAVSCALEMDVGVELECDPGECERVLSGLVANAVSAAASRPPARGVPAVSIALRRLGTDRAVLVEVRDTGPGMPAALLDASRWGRRSLPGLGIGLRQAAEFVEDMRGSVNARNDPEGGAVITLRIPVCAVRPLTGPRSCRSSVVAGDGETLVVARSSRWRGDLLRALRAAGFRPRAFELPVVLRADLDRRAVSPALVFCEEALPGSFDSRALDAWLLRVLPEVPFVARPGTTPVQDVVDELLAIAERQRTSASSSRSGSVVEPTGSASTPSE